MGKKYIRRSSRMQWTEQQVRSAMEAITRGMSVNKASTVFRIPRTTLRRQIKQQNPTAKLGSRKPVFNPTQEEELLKHLLDLENRFHGISATDVRKLAFELAEQNNIPHPFSKAKRAAGKEWLCGFLKRHPKLSFRKPEATSTARAKGFNKISVNAYFDLLEESIRKYAFPPSRIYNADETSLCTVS